MNKQLSAQEAYDELSYYTLAHSDPSFIHQHIVDAFTAQQANEKTKSIALTFALVGLYLYLEKNYSGKQVQLAHMLLAKEKREWPTFTLPEKRGDITVFEVIDAEPGNVRDDMIRKWCASVWETHGENRWKIIRLIESGLR